MSKMKEYTKYDRLSLMKKHGGDILSSENFKKSREFIQHGSISVNRHSIHVAQASIAMQDFLKKFGVRCNKRDLVRGALLHDYFLYDWHNSSWDIKKRLHGFYHPGIALSNASKEYLLTDRQKEIIKKHMWPLTVVPPMCREAWVVSMADKYCSLKETLHMVREVRNQRRKKEIRKARHSKPQGER